MLFSLLLLSSVSFILCYNNNNPHCTSCKWFVKPNCELNSSELGVCKMFKEISYNNGKEKITNNFAIHCRNNENLCGKSGFLYEPKDNETSVINNEATILNSEYEDLNNRCCGEVNETDEIEQLERDFFEIFQRIKKHNKKIIFDKFDKIGKIYKSLK